MYCTSAKKKCVTLEFQKLSVQFSVATLQLFSQLYIPSPPSLFLWSRSSSPKQYLPNPNSAPSYSPILPAIRYGSLGTVMLCYNMAVGWMNSLSTLCVYVCVCVYLAAVLSGVSACLRLISVPHSEETLN